MKVKIPNTIKIATHSYKVVFDANLRHDEASYGQVNHREQIIRLEASIPPSLRDQTLIHEIVHIVDRVYVCRMDEDDLERLSNGIAELLFNNLGVEFDWSFISNNVDR